VRWKTSTLFGSKFVQKTV